MPRHRHVFRQHLGCAEHHVIGGKAFAIVPDHVRLQVECIDQAIGRGGPGLCKRRQWRQIEAIVQQALVDLASYY
jgi:hypothetical protein